MEYQMYDDQTEVDFEDTWQMPPAQTEELPAGLIEDQI
jgi:hypothetical protein